MRVLCALLLPALLVSAAEEKKATFPAQVMMIRHGEKPPDDDPSVDLNDTGKKRAEALPNLFKKTDNRSEPLPTPDFLFATKNSKHSHRPLETITPLAQKLGVTINAAYRDEDFALLANELLQNPKYAGKTVLICWHHGQMANVAKALQASTGVPDKFPGSVFDRVWVITYPSGKASFANRPEQLLPGDSPK